MRSGQDTPSHALIDKVYCTTETKVTPAWVQGVGVNFYSHMVSLHHNVVKRVRRSTAQFRSVSCSTGDPLNVICILRIWFWAYLLSS